MPTPTTRTNHRTYQQLIADEAEQLRARAAATRGWAEEYALKEDLEYALEVIRGEIRSSRQAIRTLRKRVERVQKAGVVSGFEERLLARKLEHLAIETEHRDELVAGLREMRRQRRA